MKAEAAGRRNRSKDRPRKKSLEAATDERNGKTQKRMPSIPDPIPEKEQ